MQEILQPLENYLGVPPTEIARMADFFVKQPLAKDAFLLKEGQYRTGLSFIKEGYVRIYKTDVNSGKEITQWVAMPDTFVTDLSCLFFDMPARWNIQAVTDCVLFTINHTDYRHIGKHVRQWDRLEKLFMAKCFNTIEDRVYAHLSMTAEERYQHFFDQYPDLFNQVPLQYIASLLGMTPETFSRIRKKLSS